MPGLCTSAFIFQFLFRTDSLKMLEVGKMMSKQHKKHFITLGMQKYNYDGWAERGPVEACVYAVSMN